MIFWLLIQLIFFRWFCRTFWWSCWWFDEFCLSWWTKRNILLIGWTISLLLIQASYTYWNNVLLFPFCCRDLIKIRQIDKFCRNILSFFLPKLPLRVDFAPGIFEPVFVHTGGSRAVRCGCCCCPLGNGTQLQLEASTAAATVPSPHISSHKQVFPLHTLPFLGVKKELWFRLMQKGKLLESDHQGR